MPVNTHSAGYAQLRPVVQLTRDACAGETAVKARGADYLPTFSDGDEARWAAYKKRAVWYGATGATLRGVLGAQFNKPPTLECEDAAIIEFSADVNGDGLTLNQLALAVCSEVWQCGTVGVYVDYDNVEAGLTEEQKAQTGARARVRLYPFEAVINRAPLVLHEVVSVPNPDDEFVTSTKDQYRVLDLENGAVRVRVYDESGAPVGEPIFPTGADGKMLTEIPFEFVGVQDNSGGWENPPLYDLAAMNIAHYRNSADNEESLFYHGQGTLFVWSEMNAADFKSLNPNGIKVGAKVGHFLGANGGASLVQSGANQAIQKEMENKERRMVALGARLIENRSGGKTVDESAGDNARESSILALISENASSALTRTLQHVAVFLGVTAEIKFKMTDEFFDKTIDAQSRVAMMQELDRGIIATSDYRNALRRSGVVDPARTDADIDEENAQSGAGLNNAIN